MKPYGIPDNKKSYASQTKIYKTLRRLLKSKSLNDISVSELVSESGVSRSTFYRNYDNVSDVLENKFDIFYGRYLHDRAGKSDQLKFFFEFWYWHRDLISIIASQNPRIIRDTIRRHDTISVKNEYLFELKYAIFTAVLSKWSANEKSAPYLENTLEIREQEKKAVRKSFVEIQEALLSKSAMEILLGA